VFRSDATRAESICTHRSAGTMGPRRRSVVRQSGLTAARSRVVIRTLVSRVPGRFSSELGLILPARRRKDLFLWFLAAILYGARISGSIVAKTHAEFVRRGLTTAERVVNSGWDGLVAALDAGGYVRYDFKTATKLLEVMTHLIDRYGGDLEALHEAAGDECDLETRLKVLGKGIGEVTVQIFLRELRGIWPKAQPALSPLSLLAAKDLALISTDDRGADPSAVDPLVSLWKGAGVRGKSFSDFESALVRLGRDYCRRQGKQNCPMREFCA
jgi:endonuclease III